MYQLVLVFPHSTHNVHSMSCGTWYVISSSRLSPCFSFRGGACAKRCIPALMHQALPYDHKSINSFVTSSCYVYSHGTTYLSFCSLSLSDNKISADGVLVLAGALIVNRNLKLE